MILNNLKNLEKELAKKSINFEQQNLKEIVGSQDQIAAAYGGFNKIIFNLKCNGQSTQLLTHTSPGRLPPSAPLNPR